MGRQWESCGGSGRDRHRGCVHERSKWHRHGRAGQRRKQTIPLAQIPQRWWREATPRHWRCGVLRAALFVATGLSATAAQAGVPEFPLASSAQVYWSQTMSAQVWGRPLYYARFVTHWPLEKMAAQMSRDRVRFQVFTRLPDRLMLSGQDADKHWVAQLTSDGRGSRGLVSVWQVSAESAHAVRPQGVLAKLFQPATAWRKLLHVRRQTADKIIEQAVYQGTAATGPAMLADVSAYLRTEGWESDQAVSPLEGRWRRAKQRLYWRQRDTDGEFMIFVHYSEQG